MSFRDRKSGAQSIDLGGKSSILNPTSTPPLANPKLTLGHAYGEPRPRALPLFDRSRSQSANQLARYDHAKHDHR
jgi:hypothetical protein